MSDNIGKLREVFASALDIPKEKIVNEIEYNTIPEWDSIAHMQLVAKIGSGPLQRKCPSGVAKT